MICYYLINIALNALEFTNQVAKDYGLSQRDALACIKEFAPIGADAENYLTVAPELEFLNYTSAILIIGACAASFLPFGGSLKRDTISAYGCSVLGNFVTTLNNDRDSAKFNPNRHIEVNINSARHVKEAFAKTLPSYFPRNRHFVFDLSTFRSPVSLYYYYYYY